MSRRATCRQSPGVRSSDRRLVNHHHQVNVHTHHGIKRSGAELQRRSLVHSSTVDEVEKVLSEAFGRICNIEALLQNGFREVHSHQTTATLEVLKRFKGNFPRYFILLPDSWFPGKKRRWTSKVSSMFSKKWRVLLICEGGNGVHDWHLDESHPGYTVKFKKKWLKKALPFLKVGFKILSVATRVVSSLDFGFLDDVFKDPSALWSLLDDLCTLGDVSAENLQSQELNDLIKESMSHDNSRVLEALLLQSSDYDSLKESPGTVGGLTQITRADFDHGVVWLCEICAASQPPRNDIAIEEPNHSKAPPAAPLMQRQVSTNSEELWNVLEPGDFHALDTVVQSLREAGIKPSHLPALTDDILKDIFPNAYFLRQTILQIGKDMLAKKNLEDFSSHMDEFASSILEESMHVFLNASACVHFSAASLRQVTFDARMFVNFSSDLKVEISALNSAISTNFRRFGLQTDTSNFQHRFLGRNQHFETDNVQSEEKFCYDLIKSSSSRANVEVIEVSWTSPDASERGQFFAGIDTTQLLDNVLQICDNGSPYVETHLSNEQMQKMLINKAGLQTHVNMSVLQYCVFVRTTVVVSELLTNLPNLKELASVSCINVFNESQLSGVSTWYVFAEEGEDTYHASYPQLTDAQQNESESVQRATIEEIEENAEEPSDLDVVKQNTPSLRSTAKPEVIETRTIAAVPLAVWSRRPILRDETSRFKKLSSAGEAAISKMCSNDRALIDALGFYKHQLAQSNTTVFIIGAQGKSGRHIIQQLRERGFPRSQIRQGVREPPNSSNGEVLFDWKDPSCFEAALSGVDAIYLLPPEGDTHPEVLMNPFIDKALALGVKRFVLVTGFTIEEGGPLTGAVHAYLKRQDVEWVVLQPIHFMENFSSGSDRNSIVEHGAIYAATGDGKIAFLSVSDVASAAISALLAPSGSPLLNKEYKLTGPELMSHADVAERIGAAIGKRIAHIHIPETQLDNILKRVKVAEILRSHICDMSTAIRNGELAQITGDVRELIGREPMTFSTFLEQNKKAWL